MIIHDIDLLRADVIKPHETHKLRCLLIYKVKGAVLNSNNKMLLSGHGKYAVELEENKFVKAI